MADGPVTLGIAWGKALAEMDEPARELARRAAKQALATQAPADEVGRPPVRTLGEYLDAEIQTPPYLVQPGLVARGAISSMTSRGGKGKTAVSLNRLLRWSVGLPLFDELPEVMAPVEPLRILLIENEGSPGHFQKIIRTILMYEHPDEGAAFSDEHRATARKNLHVWGDGGWSGLKLDDPANLDLVKRGVEASQADLVFLEPFRGLWRGEENSATEMANVLDSLSGIANEYECGVLVTHHERKAGFELDEMDASRGSGVLEGHAAVMERWTPVQSGNQRELKWIKARFEEPPAPVRMQFIRERWGYRLVQEDEQVRRVLTILNEYPDSWLGVKDVASDLEESEATTRRYLNKAYDAEAIQRTRRQNTLMYRAKTAKNEEPTDPLTIT
jgi:hypothetical protein